jgi:predicted HAD superfamily Cof-like phosphohydrolase
MKTNQDRLIEFHRAIGQPILPYPQVPPDDRVRLRARLIAEEFFETMDAMYGVNGRSTPGAISKLVAARKLVANVIDTCIPGVDLVELADGLADLDYVIEGTRLECGIDGEPIAREVHRTNMLKSGGPVSPEGKRLKPPGWTPPRIREELGLQINEPEEWGMVRVLADLPPEEELREP